MNSTTSLQSAVKAAEKKRFTVPLKLLKLLTTSRSALSSLVDGKIHRHCKYNDKNLRFCTQIHSWHSSASQAISGVNSQTSANDFGLFAGALARLLTEALGLCSDVNCPNHVAVSILEEVCIQLHALCTEVSLSDTFGYYTLLLAMKQAPPILVEILRKQSSFWSTVQGADEAVISSIFAQISNCRQHLAAAESTWVAKEVLYQDRLSTFKSSSTINVLNDELWQLWQAAADQRVIIEQQHNFIMQDLDSMLSNCLGAHRYIVKLTPFGSRVSGLSTCDSDLDVSLSLIKRPPLGSPATIPEEYEKLIFDNKRNVDYGRKGKNTSSFILRIIRQFVNRDRRFYCLDMIQWARIPIIKLKHKSTNIEVDICIENQMGVQNTFLLRDYVASDNRIHCLLLAVKHWAKQRCVNQSNNGTISTFSWCLMVLYYLHNVCSPPVAASFVITEVAQQLLASCGEDYASIHCETALFELIRDQTILKDDTRSVGELFVGFFAFYGGGHVADCFDYSREAVNLRHPHGRCFGNVAAAAEMDDEEEGRDIDDDETVEEDDDVEPPSTTEGNRKARAKPEEDVRGRRKGSLWNIKISDPFLDWDLGRVVRTEETMSFIVGELRRGMYLLSERLSRPSIDMHEVWEELCQRHPQLPNGFCICPRCNQLGHIENYCPQCKCSKCGQLGHRKFVCKAKPCSYCKSFEHKRESCPRLALTKEDPSPRGFASPPAQPSQLDQFIALQKPQVQSPKIGKGRIQRTQVQNQQVTQEASEPPQLQHQKYSDKKKELSTIMRDFSSKKVSFFALDGSKVLQQQYQQMIVHVKEGGDLANFLRGTTFRFVTAIDKNKNAKEVKVFVPAFEALLPKSPNNNHSRIKASSQLAKGEEEPARSPMPVSVPPSHDHDSVSRAEVKGIKASGVSTVEATRSGNMSANGKTTIKLKAGVAHVHIVSPLPSSPVAQPQGSTKTGDVSNKPQKENRRRVRRREFAKGRREQAASALQESYGDAKLAVPKHG